ncbi:MAG: SET domain-containing protein-lysine N-methyltransferase [Acidobacteriaceae bacterium]|nr:SET domain-containing protein-lysine N-methyltransferase [Acidobacteriaceae bacterium]
MMRSASALAVSGNGDRRPRIDPGYACFDIRLGPSKIHRWGVYAAEFIPAHRKVIEYTGEKIGRRETKRRAALSEFTYLFTLDAYWTLDGSVGGSGAEYINHSCNPNLAARIMKGHILYISVRNIRRGEELTVDYRFDKKVERVACRCGSPNCRGTINVQD